MPFDRLLRTPREIGVTRTGLGTMVDNHVRGLDKKERVSLVVELSSGLFPQGLPEALGGAAPVAVA